MNIIYEERHTTLVFAVVVFMLLVASTAMVASITDTNFKLWMLGAPVFLFVMRKRVVNVLFFRDDTVLFWIFGTYVVASSIFATFARGADELISRQLLFLSSYLILLVLISSYEVIYNHRETWWRLLSALTFFFCGYGVYQIFASFFGLPFSGANIYRGRDLYIVRQISSFFDEPAFFGQFLITILYINLFVKEKKPVLQLLLIVVCAAFTFSVGTVVSVLFLFVLSGFYAMGRILGKFRWRTVVLFAVLLVIILGVSVALGELGVISVVTNRLSNEVLMSRDLIGNDPSVPGSFRASGAKRIIDEINYILLTLRERPLFGFGPNYSEVSLRRTMALNAITEIMVRWGAIGLLLFFSAIAYEKVRFPSSRLIAFACYTALFSTIDGAVAKPVFWMLIGMVLLSERLVWVTGQDEPIS